MSEAGLRQTPGYVRGAGTQHHALAPGSRLPSEEGFLELPTRRAIGRPNVPLGGGVTGQARPSSPATVGSPFFGRGRTWSTVH